MKNNMEYIEEWISELRLAPKTIKKYRETIIQFSNYLEGLNLTEVQRKNIVGYLSDKNINTLELKQSVVTNFYYWMISAKYIMEHPKPDKLKLKREEKEHKYISIDQWHLIVDKYFGNKITFLKERDYMIFYIMFAAGTRVEETVNLKITDFDMTRKDIKIIDGKGSKDRYVYVPCDHDGKNFFKVVQDYVKKYKITNYLFPKLVSPHSVKINYDQPVTDSYVRKVCKEIQTVTGIKNSPHKYRHGCGQKWYDSHIDIGTIQSQMGHKSPNTTRIYAQANRDHVREEMDRKYNKKEE